jgi:hypothetical protein
MGLEELLAEYDEPMTKKDVRRLVAALSEIAPNKDAERYLWWRANRLENSDEACDVLNDALAKADTAGEIDAAIDAEIAKLKAEDRCPCGTIWTRVMFAYDGPHCGLDDGKRFLDTNRQEAEAK